jgi:hypothetical protein
VAARRQLSLVKALKWACGLLNFEHVLKRRCAPLGEVAHSREGSLPLERWRPSTLHLVDIWHDWSVGRGGSPSSPLGTSPHTWCALLEHLVRPPPLGICLLCYIFEASLPLQELVGALGRITCVIIVIVLSFYIGIKKGFGGKLGVDLMCGCSLSCTNFEVKLF